MVSLLSRAPSCYAKLGVQKWASAARFRLVTHIWKNGLRSLPSDCIHVYNSRDGRLARACFSRLRVAIIEQMRCWPMLFLQNHLQLELIKIVLYRFVKWTAKSCSQMWYFTVDIRRAEVFSNCYDLHFTHNLFQWQPQWTLFNLKLESANKLVRKTISVIHSHSRRV